MSEEPRSHPEQSQKTSHELKSSAHTRQYIIPVVCILAASAFGYILASGALANLDQILRVAGAVLLGAGLIMWASGTRRPFR